MTVTDDQIIIVHPAGQSCCPGLSPEPAKAGPSPMLLFIRLVGAGRILAEAAVDAVA